MTILANDSPILRTINIHRESEDVYYCYFLLFLNTLGSKDPEG